MIRSATALLALVLLSGFAGPPALSAQEQAPRTHEVRRGETLWLLAERYYEDGDLWRRIFEANRDRLDDPTDVDVGLVLRIPSLEAGAVTDVTVEQAAEPTAEAAPRPARLEAQEGRGPRPIERRTVMYPEPVDTEDMSDEASPLPAVAPDAVYSAPWLVPEGEDVARAGALVGFEGVEGEVSPRRSARPQDRVLVSFEGQAPAVGSLFQVFRPARDLVDLGTVVEPTGVVRIEALEPAGAVAVVEKLYRRMAVGDHVGLLPEYPLLPGDRPEAVTAGPEVEILGFADPRPMYNFGDFVLLGIASGQTRIGDEYIAIVGSGEGWTGTAEARLQVVGVHQDHAVARITAEDSPLVGPDARVRLDRRMR